MADTIIVYGNCQAEALWALLSANSIISSAFRVRFLLTFNSPVERPQSDAADAATCRVLFEQEDPTPFPYSDSLPSDCVRIRFPSVDLNLLWPFTCPNPYNDAAAPELPWGHFPYGDRVLIECIDKGLSAEECLAYYFSASSKYMLDLDRLFHIEAARLRARDARCDVKMGSFVFEMLPVSRPLWAPNHPALPVLCELLQRLLCAAKEVQPIFDGVDIFESASANFSPGGPLSAVNVPIHPSIVDHYGLTWYDPTSRHQTFGDAGYTYEEYFAKYVETSIAVKNSLRATK